MRLFGKRKMPDQNSQAINPYWRRYDVVFCTGSVELQTALQEINKEGHVIVSVTQDYSKYTIIFKRFD